jgi:hypothetical protein
MTFGSERCAASHSVLTSISVLTEGNADACAVRAKEANSKIADNILPRQFLMRDHFKDKRCRIVIPKSPPSINQSIMKWKGGARDLLPACGAYDANNNRFLAFLRNDNS